jgi:hypothetical protein
MTVFTAVAAARKKDDKAASRAVCAAKRLQLVNVSFHKKLLLYNKNYTINIAYKWKNKN